MRIYNAPKESLHRSSFINENDEPLQDSSLVIYHLLQLDLIETEHDEDVFYLTTEAHELVDEGKVMSYLKVYVYGLVHQDAMENEDIDFDNDHFYNPVNHNYKEKGGIVAILIGVLIYLFSSFGFFNRKPSKPVIHSIQLEDVSKKADSIVNYLRESGRLEEFKDSIIKIE